MAESFLTKEDVVRLMNDPSTTSRVEAASKIAGGVNDTKLTDNERGLAQEIFRIMVNDAEVRVREALAANLKDSPHLPHDVAITLARDVDTVALPVLSFSDVLTDSDLVEIIHTQGEQQQLAIAGRTNVSESISDALIDTANENVVASLISNEGAEISEKSFEKVLDTLGDKEKIQTALVYRSALPITVAEKLVTRVSEIMREQLLERHELSNDIATDLLLQTRERATVMLSTDSGAGDVQVLVKQLYNRNRLTTSIILRALCMGDLRFFEAAMAELTHIPLLNARTLIHDPGKLGLKRLWTSAGLPQAQLVAASAAVDAAKELEYDGGANDRERFSRRLLELILTQYDELGVEFDSNDLEYLLAKISTLPSTTLEKEQRTH
jgi:uncharacterized protein (DUF2336 family)